jgi:GAF domain-containing protein
MNVGAKPKESEYDALDRTLAALLAGERDWIANLANTAALLYTELAGLNWAGFYLFKEGELVLGPFQGKPACVRIALGKGVCGTAAAQRRSVVVPDVHEFPGHIACDSASNSELVVPLIRGGELLGVLDLDSPLFARFDDEDRRGLEAAIRGAGARLLPMNAGGEPEQHVRFVVVDAFVFQRSRFRSPRFEPERSIQRERRGVVRRHRQQNVFEVGQFARAFDHLREQTSADLAAAERRRHVHAPHGTDVLTFRRGFAEETADADQLIAVARAEHEVVGRAQQTIAILVGLCARFDFVARTEGGRLGA